LYAQIVYAKHGIAEDGKGQYKMEVLFGSEVSESERNHGSKPLMTQKQV
jgi:hypothetical protein